VKQFELTLRDHIQGDHRQSPSPIHFFKVKSHAGNIGNEHADALAKKSATTYSDITDTSIRTAGPEEIPFTTSTGLQKKTKKNKHKPLIIPGT
jgi:ribonuclease HI